jgi:hypothetical protein
MSSKTCVHRLLFHAFLELRQRGHDSGDKVVFHLSDLFHSAALKLGDIESENNSDEYDALLSFIKDRAKEKGCESWVDKQLELIELETAKG